jgi:hypothetical protein
MITVLSRYPRKKTESQCASTGFRLMINTVMRKYVFKNPRIRWNEQDIMQVLQTMVATSQ